MDRKAAGCISSLNDGVCASESACAGKRANRKEQK